MTQNQNQSSRRDVLKTGAAAAAAGSVLGSAAQATEVPNINAMGPTPEQMQAFVALPEGPIVMVNLLKFKPNGGREEYAKYGEKIQPILASIGARVLFTSEAKVCLIGNADWDQISLVEYPDRMALPKMAQSEEYQAIHHHREAGLEGQVNYAVVQGQTL